MIELRGYQKEAVKKGVEFFLSENPKNSIILMPTGSGKSLVIAGIVKEVGGPCLVLQPTKEILEQNIGKLSGYGCEASIYSASFNQKDISEITYATIGSIIRKKEQFKHFKFVIVDECHYVNAKGGMYEELLNYLKVPTLGLTATPYRLTTDGYGGSILKFLTRTRPRIFKDVVFAVQNRDLFDDGYLSKVEYETIYGFDQSKVRLNSTGADFNESSLKKYFSKINHKDRIVSVVNDLAVKRRGVLVFTNFVEEAEYVASKINGSAIVTAETKKADRESIVSEFRRGSVSAVVNVGVFTVGFDYPELDTVVLARPTMSLALYYQMIGRGIRPHPNKESTLVVDMCGNYEKFGRVEDLTFHENGGLFFISNGERQLTNVYYGENKPVVEETKMPFGKYKGTEISKIPTGYLTWLRENVSLRGGLKSQVDAVMEIRNYEIKQPQKMEALNEPT